MISAREVCLILTLTVALAAGCSKKPADDGGQDGGGGFVNYSTPDEVQHAIDKALELSREPEFTRNIYYYFASHYYLNQVNVYPRRFPKDKLDFFNKILKTLGSEPEECLGPEASQRVTPPLRRSGNIVNTGVNATFCKGSEKFRTFLPGLMQADRLHITIKESGDCGWSLDDHADASVSKAGTEVCFSIERLRRVPPTSLLREVLALLYHEIFHVVGMGEDDARHAQIEFGRYFDSEFGTGMHDRIFNNTEDILNSTLNSRLNLEDSVGDTNKLYNRPATDPIVGMAAADIYRALKSLPMWDNPLAIQIAFDAPIGMAIAYTAAVSFSLRVAKDPLASPQGFFFAPDTVNSDDLTAKLTAFNGSLGNVILSWHSLTLERRSKRWSCSGFKGLQSLGDPTALEQVQGLAPAGPFLFPIKADCFIAPQK